jgi:hypothetical protein
MPPCKSVREARWKTWKESDQILLRQYREYLARTYPERVAIPSKDICSTRLKEEQEREAREQTLVRRTAEMMARKHLEAFAVHFNSTRPMEERIKEAGERAVVRRNANVLESTPPMQAFSSLPALRMDGVTNRPVRNTLKNSVMFQEGCGCKSCRPWKLPCK